MKWKVTRHRTDDGKPDAFEGTSMEVLECIRLALLQADGWYRFPILHHRIEIEAQEEEAQ